MSNVVAPRIFFLLLFQFHWHTSNVETIYFQCSLRTFSLHISSLLCISELFQKNAWRCYRKDIYIIETFRLTLVYYGLSHFQIQTTMSSTDNIQSTDGWKNQISHVHPPSKRRRRTYWMSGEWKLRNNKVNSHVVSVGIIKTRTELQTD